MIRGELYLVRKPGSSDPRRQRPFVIVSRQEVIDSRLSTLICAPVYSRYEGLSTQVPVGADEGLKHESCIHCDELVSLPKSALTHYLGRLSSAKLDRLREALLIALCLEDDAIAES